MDFVCSVNTLELCGINIMDFFLGVLFGILLHSFFLYVKMRMIERRLNTKIDEVLDRIKQNVIPSKIEESNGMYYLYNRETEEFLGQGTSMVELEKSVRAKFPDKLFDVPNEQLMKVMKAKYETE